MKGSEKQIVWAEEIKAKIAAEIAPLRGRGAHFDKMMDFILSIEDSRFWIDYRDYSLKTMLSSLVKSGLQTKGFDYAETAKSDASGNISFTNQR